VIIGIYAAFVFVYIFRDEVLLSTYGLRIFERLLISSIMLLVILEQCYSLNSFYKMKNFKIPTLLGVITYGLYCLHFIIITLTLGVTKLLGLNDAVWEVIFLETFAGLLITIAVSLFSYRHFEKPFLKLKDKFAFTTKKIA